jgi:predicted NBD/HSP70 family sugar kinase
VDNDANIAMFGEYWMGAARGLQHACLLTLGTGLGGGILIDGKILRGTVGRAADKSILPDDLRALEAPSGRRKIEAWTAEGKFCPEWAAQMRK